MRRRGDWAERLNEYLESCRRQPFRWGHLDCVLFVCGAVHAMTGEHPLPQLCGAYQSKRGAAKTIQKFGRNLEEAIEAECRRCGFTEIAPALAQRGDIVLLTGDATVLGPAEYGALGLIGTSGLPVFINTQGLMEMPLAMARRAWRI